MAMLAETLGFFTLLALLFAGFLLVMYSTQKQSKKQESAASDALKASEELEQKVKALTDQMLELRQELTLKNQMLEGLRGQYSELEKDYEKLRLKSEQEVRVIPTLAPKASTPQTTPESGSPLINII